jgi:hypothetical protein
VLPPLVTVVEFAVNDTTGEAEMSGAMLFVCALGSPPAQAVTNALSAIGTHWRKREVEKNALENVFMDW